MKCLRMLFAVLLMFPALCLAECMPANLPPAANDATFCCSGAIPLETGRCIAFQRWWLGGSPASVSDSARCCSQNVVAIGGSSICAYESNCLQGGHLANINNPGACCSGIAINVNGNVVCGSGNSNAFTVGSVFADLNQDRQQGHGQAGSDFSRNGVLSVYAVDASNRVAGSGLVAPDGYWRIDSGLIANTGYTFVLSDMRGVAIGIQSPPPALPPNVSRTGENRSSSYQASGVVDATSDCRIAAFATPGSPNSVPQTYLNFGLFDRIFANGFD